MYFHVVDFWGLFFGRKNASYEVGSPVFICKAVQTKSGLQLMAPERPQNDLPVVCLIAKQHSSVIFVSMRFISSEGKVRLCSKMLLNFFTCQALFAIFRNATVSCVMSPLLSRIPLDGIL